MPCDLLKQRIEEALTLTSPEAVVASIRAELSSAIREERLDLHARYRALKPDHYARRLLYSEPGRGYTAVVMTWGPHQETPLHDHAGIWCVEGVVEGEIEVVRYDLVKESAGLYRFASETPIHGIKGNAGSLIPPLEHHVLRNPSDQVSITLHIYGGEISRCNVFVARPDGWWVRSERELHYDD